ncbi:tagatose 1,6-diphosphate aldolase [Bauldia litoralis]|uniref:Tagatose 1,6-diphosphate aldolase n=1 Tax=Bauldia litoralis TaxID=665467 RepID=A0A1G6ENM8_9HYPH|nr:tagatose 1,6-diphosphate aldolase [Bauldia litoralis]SDB59027.1 tagatose 1,6-diphosphate aldolase [Bauldia litoralis]
MELSSGKLRGIRRLADSDGRFKMVAVDQRPPMLKALADKLGGRAPGYEDLGTAKAVLAEALLPLGSALLIDPDYGYPQAESVIAPDKGLLITLEDFNFSETADGRKTSLMRGWGVEKVKRLGADGVKLLLWYRPDASTNVVDHQKALVRSVGEACRIYDIPFLLELLVFPFKGSAGHSTDYTEDKDKHPDLVLQSLRDFADPEFGVDIYKLESPALAKSLPDPDDDTAEARTAQSQFDEISRIIDKPWVMLSAGASMEVFRRVLTYAYRAGANGYLAGRAIWWPAFQHFPDIAAMKADLATQSVNYMGDINRLTDAKARPWVEAKIFGGHATLDNAGHSFPADYPGFS